MYGYGAQPYVVSSLEKVSQKLIISRLTINCTVILGLRPLLNTETVTDRMKPSYFSMKKPGRKILSIDGDAS